MPSLAIPKHLYFNNYPPSVICTLFGCLYVNYFRSTWAASRWGCGEGLASSSDSRTTWPTPGTGISTTKPSVAGGV